MDQQKTDKTAVDENTPGTPFPNLPKAITSFGAAQIGDLLYTYGGHHGTPHHYSEAGQSNALWQLNLNSPKAWERVATGAKVQGHALVSHGDVLYLVGGFTARNKEGDDQDLWSRAYFARINPKTGKWQELPPMPDPRSSFDAVVADRTLYVVGGWAMRGKDKETDWLDSAYAFDLADGSGAWKPLPKAPFKRRAVSLDTLDGRIYVIGGMQPNGKVTTQTAVYDPVTETWADGPKLPGDGMEGFGTDCCSVDGELYVSTMSGKLLRLAKNRKSWESVRNLRDARFFHRMLPLGDNRLILLGGANMETGKFSRLEVTRRGQDVEKDKQ